MRIGFIVLTIIGIIVLISIITLAVVSGKRTPVYPDTPTNLSLYSAPVRNIFRGIGKDEPFRMKIRELPSDILQRLLSLRFKEFSEDDKNRQEKTMKLLNKKTPNGVSEQNELVFNQTRIHNNLESSVFYADSAMLKQLMGKEKFRELKSMLEPFTQFFTIKLWLNTPGYTTPMHSDAVRNIVLQLYGKKRWVLISRRYKNDCYPGKINKHNNQFFKTENPYNVDLQKFPKFKNVKTIVFDMEPGDLLYIPFNYLHFVHSLDTSIMASFIFK